MERAGYDVASVQVSTDARSPAVFDVMVQAATGVGDATHAFTFSPGLALKPAANVFIQLSPTYNRDQNAEQYVTTVADPTATAFYGTRYVFAFIETTTVSLTTRVNWTFTPNLTLQLFAQPFIASGDYSSFREFAGPRTLDKRSLRPGHGRHQLRRGIVGLYGGSRRRGSGRALHLRQPGLHHQRPSRDRGASLGVPARIHAVLRLDPGESRLRPCRRLRLRQGPQSHLRPAAA